MREDSFFFFIGPPYKTIFSPRQRTQRDPAPPPTGLVSPPAIFLPPFQPLPPFSSSMNVSRRLLHGSPLFGRALSKLLSEWLPRLVARHHSSSLVSPFPCIPTPGSSHPQSRRYPLPVTLPSGIFRYISTVINLDNPWRNLLKFSSSSY